MLTKSLVPSNPGRISWGVCQEEFWGARVSQEEIRGAEGSKEFFLINSSSEESFLTNSKADPARFDGAKDWGNIAYRIFCSSHLIHKFWHFLHIIHTLKIPIPEYITLPNLLFSTVMSEVHLSDNHTYFMTVSNFYILTRRSWVILDTYCHTSGNGIF